MNFIFYFLGKIYSAYLYIFKHTIFKSKEGKEYLQSYSEAEVKNVFFRAHAKFKGFKLIDNYKDTKKKSDTVFIVGSGESINNLTTSEWSFIQKHNIIGLNYSFVHPVIPDYHLMEMIPLPEMQDFFCEITNKNYKDVDMFFQYKHVIKSNFDLLKYKHQEKMYVHVPHLYPTVYPEVLELYFRELQRTTNIKLSNLVHHNSHIGCAVMFAQALGYKKIVMLGIDLNGGDYFTNSEIKSEAYPYNENYKRINVLRNKHFEVTQEYKNSIHPTIDKNLMKKRGGILMDDYFKTYSKIFIEPTDVELYSGSKLSKLAEFLPVFKIG